MSGGRFNYMDGTLRSEIFGWTDRPTNVFEDKEISKLVWDVLDLIHEFDWYSCGDTSEEDYLKAKAKFKQKWFGSPGERIRSIIDETIDECRSELYKTFGVSEDEDVPDINVGKTVSENLSQHPLSKSSKGE